MLWIPVPLVVARGVRIPQVEKRVRNSKGGKGWRKM